MLLKMAAQCVPDFWMNLFLIPNKICESIEVLLNGYWWRYGQENRGIRCKAWDRLCVPKEACGLGFREFK